MTDFDGRSDDLRDEHSFDDSTLHDSDNGLAQVLAGYLDRINAGERIDEEILQREQPALASRLAKELATLDLLAAPGVPEELRVLGDYELVRRIGRGGMGVVFEARQISMDRLVALKVLPAGVLGDSRRLSRFVREAKVAGKLKHPNIVGVHGLGADRDSPYYAMELVEGETLAQILARLRTEGVESEERRASILTGVTAQLRGSSAGTGADPDSSESSADESSTATPRSSAFGTDQVTMDYCRRIALAFAGVADGLQHAHESGVLHRDIKPSNLILDAHGRLRILDFGLARSEGQETLTLTGEFVGTPLYMSPEQARARRVDVDHRSDIYSLGATLYEAITWRPPLRGRNHQETISQIIERDPPSPRRIDPRLPRDLETVVLKCLRKEPGDRYGTAEALAQDLRRFARGDPVEARPEKAWERRMRHLWHARWKIAGVAVFLVLAIVVVGQTLRTRALERIQQNADYDRLVESATADLHLRTLHSSRTGMGALAGFEGPSLLGVRAGNEAMDRFVVEGAEAPVRDALELLHRAAALRPDRGESYWYGAQAHFALDEPDDALADLDELVRVAPGFLPARVLATRIRAQSGNEEALDELEKILAAESPSAWTDEWIASVNAARARRWEDAAGAIERTLAELARVGAPLLGFEEELRTTLGLIHMRAGQLLRAIVEFSRVRERRPNSPAAALLTGRCMLRLGAEHESQAEGLFEALYSRSASPDELASAILGEYAFLSDVTMARRWLDRLPVGAGREMFRALLLVREGRVDDGVEIARGLSPECLVFMWWPLVQAGRHGEGLRLAKEALRDRPDDPELLVVAFQLYLELGNYRRAFELFDSWPDDAPPEFSRMVSAARGYVLHFTGRHSESIAVFREAIERDAIAPTQVVVDLLANLGAVLKNTDRHDEALIACNDAISLSPGYSRPYFIMAESLRALGRHEEALASYRKGFAGAPVLSIRNDRKCVELLVEVDRLPEAATAVIDGLERHLDSHHRALSLGEKLPDIVATHRERGLDDSTRGLASRVRRLLLGPRVTYPAPLLDAIVTLEGRGRSSVARELLDDLAREAPLEGGAAAADVDEAFRRRLIRAELRHAAGDEFKMLEDLRVARELSRERESVSAGDGRTGEISRARRCRELAKLLRRLGRIFEAREMESLASALDPNARSLMALGEDLSKAGRHVAALALFEEAIEQNPEDPLVLDKAARAYRKAGDNDRAARLALEALRCNPHDDNVRWVAGSALYWAGEPERALELFRGGVALAPTRARESWNMLVWTLRQLGRHDEAIRASDEALEHFADFGPIHYNRAQSCYTSGLAHEALAAFRAGFATTSAPGDYLGFADLLTRTGEFVEAAEVAVRVLAAAPGKRAVIPLLERITPALRSPDLAPKPYELAERLRTRLGSGVSDPVPIVEALAVLEERESSELARELLVEMRSAETDAAEETNREPMRARLALARLRRHAGDEEGVARDLDAALADCRKAGEARDPLIDRAAAAAECRELARGLRELEREDEAIECERVALDLDPYAEAWLALAGRLAGRRRHDEALEAFDHAIKLGASAQPVLFGRAAALTRLDRDADSIETYRSAIERGPDAVPLDVWGAYATVLAKTGEHAEALEVLATARERTGELPEAVLRTLLERIAPGLRESERGRELGGLLESKDGQAFDVLEWTLDEKVGIELSALELDEREAEWRQADIAWVLEALSRDGAVRINCGGPDYVDSRGRRWGRDRFWLAGAVAFSNGWRYLPGKTEYLGEIHATDDDALYRTERWFNRGARDRSRLRYRIPLPRGRWRVTFHLADCWRVAEPRDYDHVVIVLEGEVVVDDVCPRAAGFATASQRVAEVEVLDGELDIAFPRAGKIAALEIVPAE